MKKASLLKYLVLFLLFLCHLPLHAHDNKEALTQLYAYCGFPRSLNSISQFMAVLEERKSRDSGMMVRMAEIEIYPAYLETYIQILKEEAAASVKLEPGVIAIFPMSQKDQPNQIRIVEIYASAAAYQAHLQTPHFPHYKTSTLKMVKSLKLVEMSALDSETMSVIFGKLQ